MELHSKQNIQFGNLLKGILISKLLNNPFASCSFTNFEFLCPPSVHFDCIISLPCFVLNIFEFKLSGFFSTLYAVSLHALL